MGNCVSPSRRSRENKLIESRLHQESDSDRVKVNLLLLGTGNAGKSTFFRQFQLRYGDGLKLPERDIYRANIHDQSVFYMARLAQECLRRQDTEEEFSTMADKTYQMIRSNWMFAVGEEPPLDHNLAEDIHYLWNDKHIRLTYEDDVIRHAICAPLSCAAFWDDIYRISSDTFTPTDQDCISVYNRTSGITSFEYEYENSSFAIVDIGGQRSERRKWIHVFDGADSLLYVFSLSSYDEVLFEDSRTNAMSEQLRVFEVTVNANAFKDKNIIVFLNKSDLLQKKIDAGRHISSYFEDYDGSGSFSSSVSFIKKKLVALDKNAERKIFFHTTCATNTENARRVLQDVTQFVVNRGLTSQCLI